MKFEECQAQSPKIAWRISGTSVEFGQTYLPTSLPNLLRRGQVGSRPWDKLVKVFQCFESDMNKNSKSGSLPKVSLPAYFSVKPWVPAPLRSPMTFHTLLLGAWADLQRVDQCITATCTKASGQLPNLLQKFLFKRNITLEKWDALPVSQLSKGWMWYINLYKPF
jgi:hypothetical protein